MELTSDTKKLHLAMDFTYNPLHWHKPWIFRKKVNDAHHISGGFLCFGFAMITGNPYSKWWL